VLIIGHDLVSDILAGRELELIEQVSLAYQAFHAGQCGVPHSTFLQPPDNERNRMVALPAYLGGPAPAAGVKWISSFPANLDLGPPRASATITLNCLQTGRPIVLLEASLISADRTAASAALAAKLLLYPDSPDGIGLIGCGVINLAVLRFVAAVYPELAEVSVYDRSAERAAEFSEQCRRLLPGARVITGTEPAAVLGRHRLISIATNASTPHLDVSSCRPGAVVLHVSLRDLFPEAILAAHNIVDDADHACRERTSLQLAEQRVGNRHFIDASIAELIVRPGGWKPVSDRMTAFSPFGLGILDIALAQYVWLAAEAAGAGIDLRDFLPGRPVTAANSAR
jgi:2,3-diaminopropionate biosynthesis protein SbnB